MKINAPSEELLFAVDVAQKAGAIVLDYWGKMQEIIWKSRTDFKTQADDASDKFIRESIARQYPNDSIYTEEAPAQVGNSGRAWICDPMDGTINMTRDLTDNTGVAIALVENDVPILGVNYFPKRDELYVAEMNKGAFLCNPPASVFGKLKWRIRRFFVQETFPYQKRITVSDCTDINQVVMVSNHGKLNRHRVIPYIERLHSPKGVVVTFLWPSSVAALSFVATGQLDACIHMGSDPWDMASSVPIIREAGGKVTNLKGDEWKVDDDTMLAANPALHQLLFDFTEGLPRK